MRRYFRRFIYNHILRHYRNWLWAPPYEGKITRGLEDWAERTLQEARREP